MFKSKKRLFCFLIAVILVITASTSAFAASPNETKYNNTVMASSSASISDSGLLTVVNQFQGIRGKTTKGENYSEQETKVGKEALSVIDIERVAEHYAYTFKKKTDMKLYPQPNRRYMLLTL